MAIGGTSDKLEFLRSADVVGTSCQFPLPEGRAGHISVTTADGKTLVCGGKTSSFHDTASCLQFDYETRSWRNHSSLLSEKRQHSSAVVLSKGVYVLGGGDFNSS